MNAQLGTIQHITVETQGYVTKVFVKFDDSTARLKREYRYLFKGDFLSAS